MKADPIERYILKIAVTLGFAPSEVRLWPYSDIIDLIAYDSLEPFGAIRDNWHMAVQAQLFASVHTKKGKKPPDLSEFIYKTTEELKRQKEQNFLAMLDSKVKHGAK